MAEKATLQGGNLSEIKDCYIKIPKQRNFVELPGGFNGIIPMKILPDISDSKSASYNDEAIIGRSFPMKTFSHSENRAISWTAYFMVCKEEDIQNNLFYLRAIESAVYPRNDLGGAPYAPPPVCVLSCGELLAKSKEVCAILKSYSVKFDTTVPWDEATKLPYKFSVDMQWEIVYMSNNLPGQDRIFRGGF